MDAGVGPDQPRAQLEVEVFRRREVAPGQKARLEIADGALDYALSLWAPLVQDHRSHAESALERQNSVVKKVPSWCLLPMAASLS